MNESRRERGAAFMFIVFWGARGDRSRVSFMLWWWCKSQNVNEKLIGRRNEWSVRMCMCGRRGCCVDMVARRTGRLNGHGYDTWGDDDKLRAEELWQASRKGRKVGAVYHDAVIRVHGRFTYRDSILKYSTVV